MLSNQVALLRHVRDKGIPVGNKVDILRPHAQPCLVWPLVHDRQS